MVEQLSDESYSFDCLGAVVRAKADERRRADRLPYRAVVKIAAYDGQNIPPSAEFWEVETRDLAPNGISFFASGSPPSESLIMMLGDPDDPIFITARVVHSQDCHWSRKTQCFVGCEFTERLS